MNIVFQIALSLVSWLAIMIISSTLTGLLIGGFVANREMDEIASSHEILAQEIQKDQRMRKIIGTILTVAFLSSLYYFWNVGLVVAALMLILSRAPDLIWEIKSGQKLESGNMSKPKFSVLSALLSWASLLVVWYSIYTL